MVEQVIELSAEVGDIDGGGSGSSDFVQNDPPLAPPPIHVASPVEDMEVDSEDYDEEYVADSNKSVLLRMIMRKSLDVRRVGEVHTCLAPTISHDHRQLDNSLIYRVILPLIQSNPSVSISVLQGAVRQKITSDYTFYFN
ncbi:hypothetical protein Ahy_B02g058652 [Arachis hypogaea]|uniref:Uncharacterized protein n=1 Tax=Arachis hypogaea TaxID=3818 RepID=A0A445AF19_ARAHY|nr:hypothetical protein Ahy_B02g058652 [Arachis hypogaea]